MSPTASALGSASSVASSRPTPCNRLRLITNCRLLAPLAELLPPLRAAASPLFRQQHARPAADAPPDPAQVERRPRRTVPRAGLGFVHGPLQQPDARRIRRVDEHVRQPLEVTRHADARRP